jgi:hypothetical protein
VASKVPEMRKNVQVVVWILHLGVSVDECTLQDAYGFSLKLTFVEQSDKQIKSLFFAAGEVEHVCDGNNEERYDKNTPKANHDSHEASKVCFGIQFTVAYGCQCDDDVPHAV